VIRTANQLKALVRNKSGGDSAKAQILIRNYGMERFLERLSLSRYRDNLILKGGALISSMVGLENRATLDVDATIKGLPLTPADVRRIVGEIASVPIEDGVFFQIEKVVVIMDEADYPGVRVTLDIALDKMHTPLKLDFSTGDVITPGEVTFNYRLMFEDRTISILAYNLETVLAEKMETLLARGTANTRMRDFYDILILEPFDIDDAILRRAFAGTVGMRKSAEVIADGLRSLDEVESDANMKSQWEGYSHKNEFMGAVSWGEVMLAVRRLYARIVSSTRES
jgi:predicted nucleotidyltransferase component of viral defense system